jgi:hypothetical protein
MPLPLDDAPSGGSMPGTPWHGLITRIVEETEFDGSVRVAGDLLPVSPTRRLMVETLADALYLRYFRGTAAPFLVTRTPGQRGGGDACMRLADALRPDFLGRERWSFAYRTESGVPVFAVSTGRLGPAAASCYLDVAPTIAPEVFGRLVGALDGYAFGLRAELRGHAAFPERIGSVVVTVSRADAPALARVALRMRQRSPFAFGQTVPAFTRPLAPGIGLADEPRDGRDVGRHRFRLVAAGLVVAGPDATPDQRRAAVLTSLIDASLDPAALHLNPGNPEFRI